MMIQSVYAKNLGSKRKGSVIVDYITKRKSDDLNKYIMKCGHTSNSYITMSDGTHKPVCLICDCMDILREVTAPTDGLDDRMAICTQHKYGISKPVQSNWSLPFFQYRPDHKYDSYYCGCWGWN